MTNLKFSIEGYAWAMCAYLDERYPSYRHMAEKPKGRRLWRIRTSCRATGAFLQYAKR